MIGYFANHYYKIYKIYCQLKLSRFKDINFKFVLAFRANSSVLALAARKSKHRLATRTFFIYMCIVGFALTAHIVLFSYFKCKINLQYQ